MKGDVPSPVIGYNRNQSTAKIQVPVTQLLIVLEAKCTKRDQISRGWNPPYLFGKFLWSYQERTGHHYVTLQH